MANPMPEVKEINQLLLHRGHLGEVLASSRAGQYDGL